MSNVKGPICFLSLAVNEKLGVGLGFRGQLSQFPIVHIHIHVQYRVIIMQFHYSDYSSGRLEFRSQLFLRPIATVHTAQSFQAPGWGEPANEAVGGWE